MPRVTSPKQRTLLSQKASAGSLLLTEQSPNTYLAHVSLHWPEPLGKTFPVPPLCCIFAQPPCGDYLWIGYICASWAPWGEGLRSPGKVPQPQVVGGQGQRARMEAEPRKARGAESTPNSSDQPVVWWALRRTGMRTGRGDHQGGELETMAICGYIPSWQSTRVFKFYVLVSMQILVYININVTWIIWISSYNLVWT